MFSVGIMTDNNGRPGSMWKQYDSKQKPSPNSTFDQSDIKPISYTDCANALLMMWMDNILTDGEYYKIMDKLNTYEKNKRKNE